ncbi:MAG: hypothetical protein HY704_11760 [Gemmatimonadetes bacterium]|nr:hypothetical protein [Gemmatimonadota bacterium]
MSITIFSLAAHVLSVGLLVSGAGRLDGASHTVNLRTDASHHHATVFTLAGASVR